MKTTRERTISPIPARTIPAEPGRTEQYQVVLCDVCQTRQGNYNCQICGCDVCGACGQYDPTNHGDYPKRWCPHCLKLWGDKYQALHQDMENEYYEALETSGSQWKAESLEAAKAAKEK